jgi:hypothetical protein
MADERRDAVTGAGAGTHGEAQPHWLVRPSTIRGLWWGFAVVLALTVLAQTVVYVKGYFGVDGWFGFGALYGFGSCLAMVLVAKGLGVLLKRPQDYYGDPDGEPGDDGGRAASGSPAAQGTAGGAAGGDAEVGHGT